jgi:glycosyltransferase involved in cell wall biosynthesis
MKILFVAPEYYPFGIGGGSEVYKQLVERYKEAGHSVVVLYGYYPTTTWSEKIKMFKKNNVRFYQIPLIPTPRSIPLLKTRFPCNVRAFFQLSTIIQKEKPDVAHLHGAGFLFIDIMARKLIKAGVPYIVTNHGNPGKIFKSNAFVQKVWSIYTRFFLEPTLKCAHAITFVSDYIKNDKINKYLQKSVTIYNGIDPTWARSIKKTVDIRKKYSISPREKIIFTVGRISEMKGIREMISALPRLIKAGMDIRYLVMGRIGDLAYKKKLDQLIHKLHLEEKVTFVGFLPDEEKKQF